MKPQNVILTVTKTLTADIPARRFVGFGGAFAGGGKALGVTEFESEAGEPFAVNVLGVMLVETGGAVAAGNAVASDDEGRAVEWSGGGEQNGLSLDTASGAGQFIRVVRGI